MASTNPPLPKLNEQGHYLPYPGYTIVMDLQYDESESVKQFYNSLESEVNITKYVSLLPYQSYHITLKGIIEYDKFRNLQDYNNYIIDNYNTFKQIDRLCKESHIHDLSVELDVEDTISSASCCTLLYCKLSDEDELRVLESSIIDLLNLSNGKQRFHISIGYIYKDMTFEDINILKSAIISKLEVFKEEISNWKFKGPRVCWFDDMTKFNRIEQD